MAPSASLRHDGSGSRAPASFPRSPESERPWLRGDLLAGLTLSAVLVPQALAGIAGVSPIVGLYAAPAALLRIDRHQDADATDGVVVNRIESGLFFANAENVRSHIFDAGGAEGVRAVIMDAETTPFVDITAARMLVAAHDEFGVNGVRLVLARDVGQVRDLLGCTTQDGDLTASSPTIDAAVEALRGTDPAASPGP